MKSSWFRSLLGFGKTKRVLGRRQKGRRRAYRFEVLESRQMLAVDFTNPLGNTFNLDSGHDLYIPLTSLDPGNSVAYSVQGSPSLTTQIISSDNTSGATNPTIKMNISGNGFTNQDLTFELFGTLAPTTVQHIVSLINANTYSTASFYRVITALSGEGTFRLAQGGVSQSGTGSTITDEFSKLFNSPGIIAVANTGAANSGSSEFFVTDPHASYALTQDTNLETTLDNKYAAFGQLVDGFDTYQKMIATPVHSSSAGSEDSVPTTAITINSITIVNDSHPQTAVLKISNPGNVSGPVTITVQASDGSSTATQKFTINTASNPQPVLGAVANLVTTTGTPVSFTLTATAQTGASKTFVVAGVPSSTDTAASPLQPLPANVTANVNASTGAVTLTPAAGFTGTITLMAGVRDQVARATDSSGNILGLNVLGNYYTQIFTLTVQAGNPVTLQGTTSNFTTSSAAGTLNGTGAPANQSVSFSVNGTTVMNGSTPVTTNTDASGNFTLSLPANLLGLGNNTVVVKSSTTSYNSTSTIIYAPSFQNAYTAPGVPGGSSQTIDLSWSRSALFNNELGYYITDLTGKVNGISPGAAGYAAAVFAAGNFHVLVSGSMNTSDLPAIKLSAGQAVGFYLIQNSTSANFIANNINDKIGNGPLAFFSFSAANPDGVTHVQTVTSDPTHGVVQYRWEDGTFGGDRDFNDAVINVTPADVTVADGPTPPVRVQGAPGAAASVSFQFQGATGLVAGDEFGIFKVSDLAGTVSGLTPGQAGYIAAALSVSNSTKVFDSSTPSLLTTPVTLSTLTGGQLIGFYYKTGGNTFISLPAANESDTVHFRWVGEEGNGIVPAGSLGSLPPATTLHVMDKYNGSAGDFDAYSIRITGLSNS